MSRAAYKSPINPGATATSKACDPTPIAIRPIIGIGMAIVTIAGIAITSIAIARAALRMTFPPDPPNGGGQLGAGGVARTGRAAYGRRPVQAVPTVAGSSEA
jgi:hypothetical protein